MPPFSTAKEVQGGASFSFTRECKKCRTEKPLESFYIHSAGSETRRTACKTCWGAQRKAYVVLNAKRLKEKRQAAYAANPLAKKERQLKKQYGLSLKELERRVEAQQNKCGVCDTDMRQPCVDHNHKTGQVRKLLCHSCNLALGLFKDSAKICEAAAEYLKEFDKV